MELSLTLTLFGNNSKVHKDWCDYFLEEPTFFTVIDSHPTELIFPIREGQSKQQVGKKGNDKGRWSIGLKLCWLLNDFGRVVSWDWNTMNVPDKTFNSLVAPLSEKSIVLADLGFRDKDGILENMQLCHKGTWNERTFIETAFSMVTLVADLKRIRHRAAAYMGARLAYVTAMFNVLLQLFAKLHPQESPYKMSIAQFSF